MTLYKSISKYYNSMGHGEKPANIRLHCLVGQNYYQNW